jgi:hypothetical protein
MLSLTIFCTAVLDEETKKVIAEHDESAVEVLNNANNAVSLFFSPAGAQIGDELCEKEGIAHAEFDLNFVCPAEAAA